MENLGERERDFVMLEMGVFPAVKGSVEEYSQKYKIQKHFKSNDVSTVRLSYLLFRS